VDRATDIDLGKKIETGELEAEDVVLDAARDAVDHYPDKEEIIPEDDEVGKPIAEILGATKDKAVRLVKAHHTEIAPVIMPSEVHRKFSINLDKWLRNRAKELHKQADQLPAGAFKRSIDMQARYLNVAAKEGMDFVGEWDIVESFYPEFSCTCGAIGMNDDGTCAVCGKYVENKKLVIRDTKTSKKTPSSDTAHESHQLTAYAAAAYVVNGKLPDEMKLDYLIDLKRGTSTTTLSTTRTMQDVQRYLNRLVPVISAFQSGIFLPAPDSAWWCDSRYCGYYDICPHVRHPETTIGSAKELVQIGAKK
jgi:hypothetical protein